MKTKNKTSKTVKKKVEKINIATASQANGQIPTEEKVFNFLKEREFPYKEKTYEEYQKALAKMTLPELQEHSVRIANVIPNAFEQDKLKSRLEETFLKKLAKYESKYNRASVPTTGLSPEDEQKIKDILSRRFVR